MSIKPSKGEPEKTFIRVDDDVLIRTIGTAKRRLVFIAPGIRLKVAQALANAMERWHRQMTPEHIHIVLDVDSEVARLGYGDKDMAGLELLQTAAANHELTVNHHPGIRIGLLIADDTTLIYSPTPLLIEAGSQQADKPNAIVLQAELPVRLADACALGEEGSATLEVGNDPISAAKVQEVKRDLEERPPKEYNIARVERVFNSMLHYVELRIEDYKLTSRSLLLDSKLFGVKNDEMVRRLTNRYHLFAETDSLIVEIPPIGEDGKTQNGKPKPKVKFGPRSIDEERRRIKERFIIEAGDFGLIILRKDVNDFEKEIKVLKAKIEAYKSAVQGEIIKRTDEIVEELLTALKESLKANPPDHWQKRFTTNSPTDADIKRLFEKEVRAEVIRVKTDFNPRIFYAFKDVTYQTFQDGKFRKLMEHQLGKDAIDRIFSEHDAAPEQKEIQPS